MCASDHLAVFMGTCVYMCRCMYIGYAQVLAGVDVQVPTDILRCTQLHMQVSVLHTCTQVCMWAHAPAHRSVGSRRLQVHSNSALAPHTGELSSAVGSQLSKLHGRAGASALQSAGRS